MKAKQWGALGAFWCGIAGLLFSGCASETTAVTVPTSAPRNITQGGAQDIAQFRAVVTAGEVPERSMLNEVGFFSEHAVDFPEPDCGASICSHASLAVAPRFDEGNWTATFIGLNSALQPGDLPQLPKHLLVLIEKSEDVPLPATLSSTIAAGLSDDDWVTLLVASEDGTEVAGTFDRSALRELDLVELLGAGVQSSLSADEQLGMGGSSGDIVPVGEASEVDLYEALTLAEAVSRAPEFDGFSSRVLLFTSGLPQAGLTQETEMAELAEHLAEEGLGITVFGVGDSYSNRIPSALADSGMGVLFSSTDASDLLTAVKVEAETGYFPIARDLEIRVEVADGYRAVGVHGARNVRLSDEEVILESPALFLGARAGSQDTSSGRRGGGGGWFVRFEADTEPGESEVEDARVATITTSYHDVLTGKKVEQSHRLMTPLGRGNNPAQMEPYFSDPVRAKAYMMLNMYFALDGAMSYYEQGDCASAAGMGDMMAMSYLLWSKFYQDADIDDDMDLLVELSSNIWDQCNAEAPVWPVSVPMSCFYS